MYLLYCSLATLESLGQILSRLFLFLLLFLFLFLLLFLFLFLLLFRRCRRDFSFFGQRWEGEGVTGSLWHDLIALTQTHFSTFCYLILWVFFFKYILHRMKAWVCREKIERKREDVHGE